MTAHPLIPPALLDSYGAARVLGISRSHLLKMNRTGRLGPAGVKLGECRRWARAELEAWAEAGCPPRREWEQIRRPREGGRK